MPIKTVEITHTLRMLGHAMHEGAEYVPRALLADWEARDPVMLFRGRLAACAVTSGQIDAVDRRCCAEVDEAVECAEHSPWPYAATVADDVDAP